MTQSFDEWMGENHGGLFDMPRQRECFEAGAKSRQAEVDELKATIVKYEAGLRKNKANKHKILAKNIELQKRIDALREMVKKLIDNTVLSIDDELEDQANKLLKGNKDENN